MTEKIDKNTMLKRLRNQRVYHLKRINNEDIDDKMKVKNKQKLEEIIKKLAELTDKSVDEIKNEYTKGKRGRPKKIK